ncbi:MAG: site-specific integrase, partial [Actinobacteria bacterium]|nr:site-specific integrase [Actinomycetota bacterium]
MLGNLRAARKRAERGWSGEPQRTTLAQFLRHWLEVTEDRRRPNTNRSYHDVLEKYVIPRLGRARLARLTPLQVDEALSGMASDGVGTRTRQMARTVLRAALNDAIRWGITERNVAALSSPVAHVGSERHPLTKEQLGALGELLVGDPLEAGYLFLATTGARRGAAVGLCWSDIDLDGGHASIRRSLQRVKGRGLVAFDPKTERSKREVPLDPVVVEALGRRREAQATERELAGDAWVETGYVFTSAIGTPIDPAVLTHHWERIRREIGAP